MTGKTLQMPYTELQSFETYLTPEMKQQFLNGKDWGTAEDRARRGALVLDSAIPDWATRVEVLGLNLESSCSCVLGQLFDLRKADGSLSAVPRGDGEAVDPNGYEQVSAGALSCLLDLEYTWFGFDIANRLLFSQPNQVYEDSLAVFLGFDRKTSERDTVSYAQLTDAWSHEIGTRLQVSA